MSIIERLAKPPPPSPLSAGALPRPARVGWLGSAGPTELLGLAGVWLAVSAIAVYTGWRKISGEHFESWSYFAFDPAFLLSVSIPVFTGWVLFGRIRSERAAARHIANAERGLRESSARYDDLLEGISDLVWELGPDLRFTFIASGTTRLAKTSAAALIGRCPWETPGIDPESPRWLRHRADLEARRRFRNFEFAVSSGDGLSEHWRVSGKPVFDAGGVFLGYRGVTEDVTEEVAARETAEQTRGRFVAALESISQGFALFDADDRLVLCNRTFRELNTELADLLVPGVAWEDLLGAKLARAAIVHDFVSDEDYRRYQASMHGGSGKTMETRLRDGRWLLVGDYPTPDGGTAIVQTDITAHKVRQSELDGKSSLLRATLDNMSQGLSVFDKDMRLIAWNHQFLELLDIRPELAEFGRPFADFMTFESARGQDAARSNEEQAAETALSGTPEPIRFERPMPNGTTLEIRRTPMPVGGFVTTYTDFTPRRQAEDRLRHAQKLEEIGILAGGMAHEFNNLLTVISGFARMALRKPKEVERVQECLNEVISAADRAAGLTRDMLAFSRKQPMEPELVRNDAFIGGLQRMLRALLGEIIQISIETVDQAVMALVDRGQLTQVIVNLAANARDAMPDGGVLTITSSATTLGAGRLARHPGRKPGRYAAISVRDTGNGMDEDTMVRVFEPFFTTKAPGEGTGLGLSVVYGIIEQSGGIIEVTSAVGQGSAFTIFLPAVAGDPDSAVAMAEAGSETQARTGTGAHTILLVEDEDSVRRLVEQELAAAGHRVLAAGDGEQAIELQRGYAGTIDLLLTDVVMPRMGGGEAARVIQHERPAIKVLFMTGYASRGGLDRGDLGPNAVIMRKPFTDRALLETIESILGERSQPVFPLIRGKP